MGILIQDGKATGHRNWLLEAIDRQQARGTIISPFSTPPTPLSRMPSASSIASDVIAAGAELIFDATTHAAMLPGVNNINVYNRWNLWSGDPLDLSTPELIRGHVERVFAVQNSLNAPPLTPTVPLDAAVYGPSARAAIALGEEGANLSANAWQSLAGSRTFWSSGAALDSFVGNLAQLRAPVWVLTMIRDRGDYPPNASDTEAEAGLARTVHSLAMRSRVIVAQGDFFALPSVAAGADAVGTGWHSGQRICSGETYRERSGGVNRRYVTHGVLLARLRPDVANALERNSPNLARTLRDDGPFPIDDAGARSLHLTAVRDRVNAIRGGQSARERVALARSVYAAAQEGWARVAALLPGLVRSAEVELWVGNPRAALEMYAVSEGL
jgi:hypothetical protein